MLLAQNIGGQAEILKLITRFRARSDADPSAPLSRAWLNDPHRYVRLVDAVEWKLIEMPLPRLQTIGKTETPFLYRIAWDRTVRRQDLDTPGFDHHVHLLPGVADQLVRLAGLLRPLVQRAWAGLIAGINPAATDEARLQEFLFGARRIATDPIRADLRDLQDDHCFYCERLISGSVEVDHFVPWARYPDNGIDNLVAADSTCNQQKRDFLAAGEHVARWAERFADLSTSTIATQLQEIAARAGWERHADRTRSVARGIYLRLPADVGLWVRRGEFTPAGAQLETLRTALAG